MGKGEYYKNKYGGGGGKGGSSGKGGGKGGGKGVGKGGPASQVMRGSVAVGTREDLIATLRRIDGSSYGAYHDLEATWDFGSFRLTVDRAQSDPFAGPSRCHVQLSPNITQFPQECLKSKTRAVALADYICRQFYNECALVGANTRTESGGYHGAKGGELNIMEPSQYVLERSAVLIQKVCRAPSILIKPEYVQSNLPTFPYTHISIVTFRAENLKLVSQLLCQLVDELLKECGAARF
jgi:hypothetical protein